MNPIARRLLTSARPTRPAAGAAIALVLALAVVAAPAAAASPAAAVATPIRTVYGLHLGGFTIPAGQACTFPVEGQPAWGFTAVTDFPDGRELISERAHGAYVNAETGARYPTADDFFASQRFDPTTGDYYVELSGQAANAFLPGDTGPFGIVGPGPAFYDFVGKITFTYNVNTGQTTDFTYRGTVTDICAALS